MFETLKGSKKFSSTTLDGDLTRVISEVKISDFNNTSQNLKTTNKDSEHMVVESTQLHIDEN